MGAAMSNQTKAMFTPREAAEFLWGEWNATTRKRIYRWIKNGQLKSTKDGRSFWIPAAQLFQLTDTDHPGAGGNQAGGDGEIGLQIGNG